MSQQSIITLSGINVDFGREPILNDFSLEIADKEFVTLLGPSGCGKTTTLRVIGGFIIPSKGKVTFDGQDITDLPPYKRNVNTVFQRYALFPHLDVYENVAFGLRVQKLSETEIKERVKPMLEMVGLKGFEGRSTDKLSGGQQQRVAIARALVNHPRVLLLDEPLGALDLKLRKEMQIELKRIQQSLDITFIYVTHDQEEALTMSDRVVVMKDGLIQQSGTPQDIYNEPINSFVADFIGESNIITGFMPNDYVVEFGGATFDCVDKGFGRKPVQVVVRPEDIDVVPAIQGKMSGLVKNVVFKGVHYEIEVEQAGYDWIIHSTQSQQPGEMIGLNIGPEEIHIMEYEEREI